MNIEPYKSFDDLEPHDIGVSCFISDAEAMDDERTEYAYKRLREEFGNNLLDYLDRFKSPCVVEIIEKRRRKQLSSEWSMFGFGEEISIVAKVNNVRYRDVEFLNLPPIYVAPNYKSMNLTQRICWLFTGKTP